MKRYDNLFTFFAWEYSSLVRKFVQTWGMYDIKNNGFRSNNNQIITPYRYPKDLEKLFEGMKLGKLPTEDIEKLLGRSKDSQQYKSAILITTPKEEPHYTAIEALNEVADLCEEYRIPAAFSTIRGEKQITYFNAEPGEFIARKLLNRRKSKDAYKGPEKRTKLGVLAYA